MNKQINIVAIVIFLVLFFVLKNKLIAISALTLFLVIRNFPYIIYMIGSRKAAKYDMKGAAKYYEYACNIFYAPINLKISYGYFLLINGELDKSEKLAKELMKLPMSDKDKINLNLNYSIIMWKKNKIDEAIEILDNLYKKNFKTTIIYQNLGYFLLLKGNYEEALRFNLEGYEYDSANTGILDNLAQTYFYLKDYDKAIELYEKLMESNPTFATAYYCFAQALEKKERYKDALDILEDGLKCKFNYLSITKKEDLERAITEIKSKIGENELNTVND